jgi:MFS family permease
VPTRQSYVMAVVDPHERSAASGITGVARTTGAALSPLVAGLLFARPALISVPFFIAGTLKIAYDLLLFRAFRAIRPPEDMTSGLSTPGRHASTDRETLASPLGGTGRKGGMVP